MVVTVESSSLLFVAGGGSAPTTILLQCYLYFSVSVHAPGQRRRLIPATETSESLYQPAFRLGPPPCLSHNCVWLSNRYRLFPISNV